MLTKYSQEKGGRDYLIELSHLIEMSKIKDRTKRKVASPIENLLFCDLEYLKTVSLKVPRLNIVNDAPGKNNIGDNEVTEGIKYEDLPFYEYVIDLITAIQNIPYDWYIEQDDSYIKQIDKNHFPLLNGEHLNSTILFGEFWFCINIIKSFFNTVNLFDFDMSVELQQQKQLISTIIEVTGKIINYHTYLIKISSNKHDHTTKDCLSIRDRGLKGEKILVRRKEYSDEINKKNIEKYIIDKKVKKKK